MKKGTTTFLKIFSICLAINATMSFIFALMYKESPEKCENISDVDTNTISERPLVYCENLEILERYAFKTVREYTDSEGTYSNSTYYIYEDYEPMDDNELFVEYYIVKFSDKSGNEYIAPIIISPHHGLAQVLQETPLTISACMTAAPIHRNSSTDELDKIEEEALNECSEELQIKQAKVYFVYEASGIEQYYANFAKEVRNAKILAAVVGVMLIGIAIWLLRFTYKKTKKTEKTENHGLTSTAA